MEGGHGRAGSEIIDTNQERKNLGGRTVDIIVGMEKR